MVQLQHIHIINLPSQMNWAHLDLGQLGYSVHKCVFTPYINLNLMLQSQHSNFLLLQSLLSFEETFSMANGYFEE